MEQVLTKALAFVIIIAFDYLLKQRGFFKPDDYKLIAKIVLNIMLPCAVIASFAAFKMEYTLFVLTLIGFLGNLLMIVWGFMLTRYQTNAAKIFYVFNLAGYNIGCFTLPFAQSFLGLFAVVATCMFDVGNSIMCTGGTYALASGLVHTGKKYEPVTLRSVAAKLLSSVPFVVYVLLLVCALFEVHLPQPVYTLTGLIGSANTFFVDVDDRNDVRNDSGSEETEAGPRSGAVPLCFRGSFGMGVLLPCAAQCRSQGSADAGFWRPLRRSHLSLLPGWAAMLSWLDLPIP
ncbi:MAG: hypothetical protein LUC29_01035 [Acidaminococcaceae bacterium]|nr:hypothetical protein [Acidaminococcaceae bacterium]